MAYKKTLWKDQDVENPRTYSVRQNLDRTITLLDAFGEITEIGTPVNADNMNKIEEGISNSIDKTNITNCITEIPQDIKLELKDGTLTLKAGSRVYDGNGLFKDISSDLTLTPSGYVDIPHVIFVKEDGTLYARALVDCASGTTVPSSGFSLYYNTNDKKVYQVESGTVIGTASFPLCVFNVSGGVVTAVTKVFNGMGYIGSTIFALPGVEGLIPNGRNEDGSLRNIEFTVDKVVTRTITWNNVAGQSLFIGKYNLNEDIKFISSGHIHTYFQQEDEPSLSSSYAIWYKPSENKIYRVETVSEGEEVVWKENFSCYIGQWFSSGTSPYPITKLTTKLPFRAVDYNDYAEDIQKCKLIAYETGRNPGSLSGSYTLVLQDNDERVSLQVADNVTITIDTSQLTFPEEWYTMVFEIYFTNGAKTVNLSYAGGIRWINGLTPDFTNGRVHLLALTKHRVWGDIVMSDAGTLGG